MDTVYIYVPKISSYMFLSFLPDIHFWCTSVQLNIYVGFYTQFPFWTERKLV
jgi:hypothetical protein